jgi:hypothetical protein
MRWAIAPRGAGNPVGFRAINTDADLQPGEFASTTDPAGKVLAADGGSLRQPTIAELLDSAKAERLEHLKSRRNAAIEAGIVFNGRRYWTDRDSILDIASALVGFLALQLLPPEQRATLTVPPAVPWKTQSGYLPHTVVELIMLYAQVSQYRLTQHAIEDSLIAAVNAATTLQAVNAVDWPT